jgi:hypothetical protein
MTATGLNLRPDMKGDFMKKRLAHTVWECKYIIFFSRWIFVNGRRQYGGVP